MDAGPPLIARSLVELFASGRQAFVRDKATAPIRQTTTSGGKATRAITRVPSPLHKEKGKRVPEDNAGEPHDRP